MKKEVNNKAQNGYVAGGTALSRNSEFFKFIMKEINAKNTTKTNEKH